MDSGVEPSGNDVPVGAGGGSAWCRLGHVTFGLADSFTRLPLPAELALG